MVREPRRTGIAAALLVLLGKCVATPKGNLGAPPMDSHRVEKRFADIEAKVQSIASRLDARDAPRLAVVPSLFNFLVCAFLALLLTGAIVLRGTKDWFEFCSYLMPVLAALIGGAGLYFTKAEHEVSVAGKRVVLKYDAICYALSVLLLIVGVCSFLVYKEKILALAMAALVPFAFVHTLTGVWIRSRAGNNFKFVFWFWVFLTVILASTSYCWIEWVAKSLVFR